MKYIIFDLEASCWQNTPRNFRQEIIEIGAYKLNDYGEVSEQFQMFVRPVVHPTLSSFCTNLTTIKQQDVDRAKGFVHVMEELYSWLDPDGEEYRFISWGINDKHQLLNDSEIHKYDISWLIKNFRDMKEAYNHIKKRNEPPGFQKALEMEGIVFNGQQHRALNDARHAVLLFLKHIDSWSF
jgi:3'-5' exoribonuclease 1